jgi:4-amino-4-deoxy-L-arabinose transferase-like glycosyltransferase
MFRRLDNRAGHYLLLAAVWAVLCLPGLGAPSLWDIDEGNNSEAAQEMFESGNYVVPSFNYQVRYDKPALLYWLQAGAYAACGVNEFAARLPSALAALLAVLATCELGRALFGKSAGLLAGLVLASAVAFCASAHFANPDALLNLFTALTLLCFWNDYAGRGRGWFLATGVTTGLGVLAKGPAGLVLPMAVMMLFLLWRREWRRVFDPRLAVAALIFLAVAAPWYVWVGVETKGEWPREFWLKHNWKRATTALEGHRGPFYYYPLALVGGLAPWSVFLGPTGWVAWRSLRRGTDEPDRPAFQFLACWVAVYFLFFSVVRTKLPNYILPLYPAAAVLTACFLDRWRRGEVRLPGWVMRVSLECLALLGVGVVVGLLVAGGVIPSPLPPHRLLPGLGACAGLGLLWVAGAGLAGWCLYRGRRAATVGVVAGVAVAFAAGAAAWGAGRVDPYKAPRALAHALPADQLRRDVRVGAFDYFQPSLVFYCRREVRCLRNAFQVLEVLQAPLPAYVVMPARTWGELQRAFQAPYRVVAGAHDLYDGHDVVLVTNEWPASHEPRALARGLPAGARGR